MSVIYGYCRVSRPTQKLERQVSNIKAAYPDAIIIREVHTRTSFDGRKEWAKLMRKVKPGDTIAFDSVSRLSGNADEGFAVYESLFYAGVNLVFLKEPHIDTDVYRQALNSGVQLTGGDVDYILEGVNKYLMALAKAQIRLAFEQSEKEVTDLRQRTKEGIAEAAKSGKQLGRPGGKTYTTKKCSEAKGLIRKHAKTFGGSLKDIEVIRLLGISTNSYYKYKKQVWDDVLAEQNAKANF